jgi:hypothetical protein
VIYTEIPSVKWLFCCSIDLILSLETLTSRELIMADWYYLASEGRIGPVSLKNLANFLLNHPKSELTLVWREGLTDWISATEVSELAFVYRPSIPPPLPKESGNRPEVTAAEPHTIRYFERLWFFVFLIEGISLATGINPAWRELADGLKPVWELLFWGGIILTLTMLATIVLATSRGRLPVAKWLLTFAVVVGAIQELFVLRSSVVFSTSPFYASLELASVILQCASIVYLFSRPSTVWLSSKVNSPTYSSHVRRGWRRSLAAIITVNLLFYIVILYAWLVPISQWLFFSQ